MSNTRPDVVIVANVEDMRRRQERMTRTGAEWDAMTPVERALTMADFGATVLNEAGGYGVSVEAGADEAYEVATLADFGTLTVQVERLTAALRTMGLTGEQIEAIKDGSA